MDGQVMSKKAGQAIYLAGISLKDEDDYRLLRTIRNKVETGEGGKIVIMTDPRVLNARFRKIVKCSLRGAAEEVILYDMGTQPVEEGEKWAAITRKKKQKTPAIMITNKEKTYEDILRDLKTKITGDKVPEGIRAIRKSRAGDLIVELEDDEGTKALHEEISKTICEAEVKILKGKRTTIHIYDVDAVITAAVR